MISRFKDSGDLTFLFKNVVPYFISFLLAFIEMIGIPYYLDLTIRFNQTFHLWIIGFALINVGMYHTLIARHKSLRYVKRKSGRKIFFNHIKVFIIIYLLASAYFRSLLLSKWNVWWPSILFPSGYLTLITGVLRFLVKRKMGKWYPH